VIKRCIYCGRYGNKMESRECQDCIKELKEVKEQVERHKKLLPFNLFDKVLAK